MIQSVRHARLIGYKEYRSNTGIFGRVVCKGGFCGRG